MAVTIALAMVLVLPSVTDVRIMHVDSGSMEPTLAIDDTIVVMPRNEEGLADTEVGEIISYSHDGATITHRVTANRSSLGEFETKGDANEYADIDPVPYANVIGVLWLTIPQGRQLFDALVSPMGKVYLVLGAICAVLLWVRGGQVLDRQREMKRRQEEALTGRPAIDDYEDPEERAERRERTRRRNGTLLTVAKVLLLVVFVVSAGLIVRYRLTQKSSIDIVNDAREHYVTYDVTDDGGEKPPIDIDFDSMLASNPDVVGWIYCEGTQIDFPVLKGDDNDFYLRRNWRKEKDICGSIFVDANASDGFADARTVVYGHHMNDNLMFASLEEWADQDYYEAHSVMWLLTPNGNYKVELVAGEHIPAESDAYEPAREHDATFQEWLTYYVNHSDFRATSEATADRNYIMLSTCAYVYENARYTILGKLVAV